MTKQPLIDYKETVRHFVRRSIILDTIHLAGIDENAMHAKNGSIKTVAWMRCEAEVKKAYYSREHRAMKESWIKTLKMLDALGRRHDSQEEAAHETTTNTTYDDDDDDDDDHDVTLQCSRRNRHQGLLCRLVLDCWKRWRSNSNNTETKTAKMMESDDSKTEASEDGSIGTSKTMENQSEMQDLSQAASLERERLQKEVDT